MQLIYNSNFYKPFDISEDYKNLLKNVFLSESILIISDNYFINFKSLDENEKVIIVHDHKIFISMIDSKKLSQNTIKPNCNFWIGKLNSDESDLSQNSDDFINYIKFQKGLLKIFLNWTWQFLNCLHEHLKNRESDGKPLTQNDLIKNYFSDVISDLKSTEYILGSELEMIKACSYLLESQHKLARLAGGRAFLSKNILEMYWVLAQIKNIYF